MLKRPTLRRRSETSKEVAINLVPMLDTLVTLIAFLLYSMTFLAVVSIDSPVPVNSAAKLDEKIQTKPLQLTLTVDPEEAVLWSPFNRVERVTVANLEEGKPDLQGIHAAVLKVKQQFPKERQLVIAPHPGVSYDSLISIMDSVLKVDPTDPPIYVKNAQTGNDEVEDNLFPEVVFGNLLGDS